MTDRRETETNRKWPNLSCNCSSFGECECDEVGETVTPPQTAAAESRVLELEGAAKEMIAAFEERYRVDFVVHRDRLNLAWLRLKFLADNPEQSKLLNRVCRDCGTGETTEQREFDKDCACGGTFEGGKSF